MREYPKRLGSRQSTTPRTGDPVPRPITNRCAKGSAVLFRVGGKGFAREDKRCRRRRQFDFRPLPGARPGLSGSGLGGTAAQQPRLLSGGMKQRASIARALLKSPAILLCDEPTSALDAESGQVVMGILKRIALEEQRIVVVVSHDARVFPYADRLIKLENGRVVSDTRERYVEGEVSAP